MKFSRDLVIIMDYVTPMIPLSTVRHKKFKHKKKGFI